ncbi:DnaJ-like protein subfamily B member 14 [Armadillidium nasatum]|uniref:DnaJ-like protein subfamily B member 14 n=1 Tax=Armadillidium nasatum TaxID=96803 RepID=A0A5N5SW85_9CRUS|nr:DnaJ-like protein subfamily B member 14 [Armadillidium nasatum]
MVHEGNRDEADKCFALARENFNSGNRDKALKFALKAQKLFPTQKCNDFIELLNRLNATSEPQSNGSAEGAGREGSRSRRNSNENIRQRSTDTALIIKKCKDYYEILGVTKEATDSDLKKSYRKLALQFHPDKNKAPGADEAFKAVGNAFAVLSDPEKRKQYDLYGPEESSTQNHRSYSHHDYTRGYEGDVTAEELFNMFFGGSYPGGSVYVRRNGRWERSRTGHPRTTTHHHHETSHADQSSLSVFLQLMPLLLILLLSLFSSLLSSDPIYSLSPTSKYTMQRTTHNLGINYYVKQDFASEYQGSIRRLESQVEDDYINTLKNGCYKERNYKENMIWRARSFGDAHLYRKAQDLRTPSCDTLHELYS